jgi:hypothetical protein
MAVTTPERWLAPRKKAIDRMPWTDLTQSGTCRECDALVCLERLSILGRTDIRRLGQSEENDLLARDGADVMVQAQYLDASGLLDHRFQDRPRRFDQMGAYLLEQIPPFLGRQRLDQLLFSGGQNAFKADHEEITEEMGVNTLGTPAHVVLLKMTNSFRNSGFDLSQCSHRDAHQHPLTTGIPKRQPAFIGGTGADTNRTPTEKLMYASHHVTMTSVTESR